MPGVGSSKPPSYHQLRRSLCRSIHQQIIRTSLPDFFPSVFLFFFWEVRRLIINMGERRVDTSTSFGTSTLFPMASFTYNDGTLFIYVVWSDLRRSTHGSRANAYRNFFLCKATDIVSFLLVGFDRFDESSCMYVSSFGYDRKGRGKIERAGKKSLVGLLRASRPKVSTRFRTGYNADLNFLEVEL